MVRDGIREEDGSVFPCAVEGEASLEGTEEHKQGGVWRVCVLMLGEWEF